MILVIEKQNMIKKEKTEKDELLKGVIDKIKGKYKDNSIISFGDLENNDIKTEFISTGSYGLDYVLGGGFPKRRIVEISGMQSSGKTALALQFIGRVQKQNLKCAFIDVECSFDSDFAKVIGVNLKELVYAQPDNGEDALSIVEDLVDSGAVDVIVLDSVAALTPKKEIDAALEKQDMALQAKLIAKFLRRVTAKVAKNNVVLIMINQLRDVFNAMPFGPQTQTVGGNALRFYSSVRLKVSKGKSIKVGEETVGNELKIRSEKNKVASPNRECDLSIIYTEGIDLTEDVMDWGEKKGVISKSGNTYSFKDQKLGVGKEDTKKFLKENTKILEEIRKEINKILK